MKKSIVDYYIKKNPDVYHYACVIARVYSRGWISDALRLSDYDNLQPWEKTAARTLALNNI